MIWLWANFGDNKGRMPCNCQYCCQGPASILDRLFEPTGLSTLTEIQTSKQDGRRPVNDSHFMYNFPAHTFCSAKQAQTSQRNNGNKYGVVV
jgi:hypothetical protein